MASNDITGTDPAVDANLPFLDRFNVNTIAYKYIQGEPVLLDVLVPKDSSPGEHPVNIRFHGGFLIVGSRNDLNLTPPRILQHSIRSQVILITCDYRLLPESHGLDVLDDINDIWAWVHDGLNEVVGSMTSGQSTADLKRILVSGESAGGYLALQMALTHPSEIRAVIASYPMIDMRSAPFDLSSVVENGKIRESSHQLLEGHLARLPDGPQPSKRSLSELHMAVLQQGRFLEFFGQDRILFPTERLEDEPQLARWLPFIWLHHGDQDAEVPIAGSRKFVEKLRAFNPSARLRYCELKGAGHGIPSEIYLVEHGEWSEGIEEINKLLFDNDK